MPRCRVVSPHITILPLSDGDTLTVRKRLNAGEETAMFARMMRRDGLPGVDPLHSGLAQILAYLIDWTLIDPTGARIEILRQPIDVVTAALNSLDPEDFKEIKKAIEAHEQAMDAERAAEKKARAGGTGSSAISPSPDTSAGATSGSAHSTETSIPSPSTS